MHLPPLPVVTHGHPVPSLWHGDSPLTVTPWGGKVNVELVCVGRVYQNSIWNRHVLSEKVPETMWFLSQVAYQIGNYEMAKKVFSPVWDYFVASPLPDEQSVICLSNIMTITQKR